MKQASKMKMPALALTDHGNMCGTVDFYNAAKNYDIKPIIGCELYMAPVNRADKNPHDKYFHLTVLSRNEQGYRNLLKLTSIGYTQGFYYRPRADKEVLRKHGAGLIILSGCLQGEIPSLLLAGKFEEACKAALEFQDIVGKENFYLELMDHGMQLQADLNGKLVDLSNKLGIPLVASNDVHYLSKRDCEAHEVFINIGTKQGAERRSYGDELFLKTPKEMEKIFKDFPEAYENTLKVAERCSLELDFDVTHLPQFAIPESDGTPESYMAKLAWAGVRNIYPKMTPEIEERMNYELGVIGQMGYSTYFLIVQDFIQYAKSKKIPVGPGRGSAAGSLVCYALGITSVDPLEYGLIFERFLNPDRIELPDIDIDFCVRGRDEVIRYVEAKYGSDHVAQIVTFDTMAARGAIRDVSRSLGISYGDADRIAKLIPFGNSLTQAVRSVPELKNDVAKNPEVKHLIDVAKKLEGMARNPSTHAAGVVIAPTEIDDYAPLMKLSDGSIVTQFEMNALGAIGMLKMDFLGLRNLTVIDDAVRSIESSLGEKIDIESIPLDDEKTYQMLRDGQTSGVFQLEGAGLTEMLVRLDPTHFKDLIAILALYRPGPLESGMANDYIERKHGRQDTTYPHEKLKDILEDSYGLPIFQDQVLMMARVMAGFTLAEADSLRKAIGKKNKELMDQQRQKFIDGCIANKISEKKADTLFGDIEKFARYGFVKAHSTAYAMISYWTAYLKANYLVHYMSALLTSVSGNSKKVNEYINACRDLKVEVLPPDINQSKSDFAPIGKETQPAIRFGLSAIKNVGQGPIQATLEARNDGPFESFIEYCQRVAADKLNREILDSLIKTGAFDAHGSRLGLIELIPEGLALSSRAQNERISGQTSFFVDKDSDDDNGVANFTTASTDEYSKSEILQFEKELLGLYVSGHPLEDFEDRLSLFRSCPLNEVSPNGTDKEFLIGGRVEECKNIQTKSGSIMSFITLEDLTGQLEIVIFPELYEKYNSLIQPDALLMIRGAFDDRKGRQSMVANLISSFDELDGRAELHLLLQYEQLAQENLINLQKVFQQYSGQTKVYFHIENGSTQEKITAGPDWNVEISPSLCDALEQTIGQEKFKIYAYGEEIKTKLHSDALS
jgi:DNA polymerase-3 subunit alpha